MENKDDQKKMDELLKQVEEEQMRLYPEIYDKKLNNEVDK